MTTTTQRRLAALEGQTGVSDTAPVYLAFATAEEAAAYEGPRPASGKVYIGLNPATDWPPTETEEEDHEGDRGEA